MNRGKDCQYSPTKECTFEQSYRRSRIPLLLDRNRDDRIAGSDDHIERRRIARRRSGGVGGNASELIATHPGGGVAHCQRRSCSPGVISAVAYIGPCPAAGRQALPLQGRRRRATHRRRKHGRSAGIDGLVCRMRRD